MFCESDFVKHPRSGKDLISSLKQLFSCDCCRNISNRPLRSFSNLSNEISLFFLEFEIF